MISCLSKLLIYYDDWLMGGWKQSRILGFYEFLQDKGLLQSNFGYNPPRISYITLPGYSLFTVA